MNFVRTYFFLAFLLVVSTWAAQQPPFPPQNPPLPPSPIQQFRDWLAMNNAERENAVASWPAEKRVVLLQKLKVYEALPAEERERRLRMIELRWYLRPLMAMTPDERKQNIPLIPGELRQIVQQRLQHWDSLAPAARTEILANDEARELVTKYYLQVQQGRPLAPERRAEYDRALERWNSLSPSARTRTGSQLTAFFQLPREEQVETFQALSEVERRDVERTLQAFASLSPEQRRVCIESFQKFTMMPPPERASFLRNAARWQAMTPEERTTWKNVVTKLPPLPTSTPRVPLPEPSASKRKVAQTVGGRL